MVMNETVALQLIAGIFIVVVGFTYMLLNFLSVKSPRPIRGKPADEQ